MRIFLVENGQKTGPFPSWEVRGRLDRRELTPDTLGWHEGCDNWMPLRDLPALGYQETPPPPPPEELSPGQTVFPSSVPAWTPPPEELRPRPWLRFWARWFDLNFWFLLIAIALQPFQYGFDKFIKNPWMSLVSLLFLLVAEAFCIAGSGATPGKALLGIRVRKTGDPAGTRVGLHTSLRRSFLVYAAGHAFFVFPLLTLGTWTFHNISLLRRGSTWWDRKLGLEVTARAPGWQRVLLFVGVYFLMQYALQALVGEEMQPLIDQLLREAGATPPAR